MLATLGPATQAPPVITTLDQAKQLPTQGNHLDLTAFAQRAPHRHVLMASPQHFRVARPSNAHVTELDNVDLERAQHQHSALARVYRDLGLNVAIIQDVPEGLDDIVFAANQSFPFLDGQGQPHVLLSKMFDPVRRPEVAVFREWYARHGYEIHELSSDVPKFEGMGDALWLYNRNIILGGHGFRSDLRGYDALAQLTGAQVFAFELRNDHFYHNDTCASNLTERATLVCPEAFTAEGQALWQFLVPNLLAVPLDEAINGFACNAHCPDGKHVIIQKGNTETEALLRGAGFTVIPVDTDELMKAGGSVFCMKMMVPLLQFIRATRGHTILPPQTP